MDLHSLVADFGKEAKRRLSSVIRGNPEEQLRVPLEGLIAGIATLNGIPSGEVLLIPETRISGLSIRPDYAVMRKADLVGFIEIKAPGKGADPRRFTDA